MRKLCPNCGPSGLLETDYTAGNVICLQCGCLAEEGILVSEVGFSEGAGGRVHVQGTFVSHYSTGIAGFRGRGGQPNSETVKQQGQLKIDHLANDMGLGVHIKNGARRFFGLAVDNKFNRGRKTEYIIASCLYLQCRLQSDSHMLIDFSERLRINVYELGATYLKLRSALHLTNPMPEVDPAIYNLRFALKLDLGSEVNVVATDASRLVRRFKADWMTQGRRPAGVCGACIIIAARMSNYLRTPQEVAQVVKVSPSTIRRRLLEFAQTKVASKTMAEWRSLTDKELLAGDAGEDPPVVKKARAKAEAIRIEALRKAEEEALVQAEEEQERAGPQRTRRKKKRKGKQATTSDDSNGVSIQPLFDGDDSDRDLDELEPIDYVNQMTSVRDNPEEVAAELRRDTQAFRKENRQHLKEPAEVDDRDLEELVSEVGDDGKDDGHGEKTENLAHSDDDSDVLEEKDEVKFDAWHDSKATIDYLGTKYFSEEERLLQLTAGQLRDRVKAWLKDREPREVVKEIEIVEKARRRRERTAKAKVEEEFPDLDDEELEAYYMMREPDVRARARLWLSQNGKWLTENKERQERKAAYNKARGIDPSKPEAKRKRKQPRKTPYGSARDAIEGFATEKNFSTRINYDVLKNLGCESGELDDLDGLERFEDEKDDEDEKYDDEKEDDNQVEEDYEDDAGGSDSAEEY